MSAKMRESFDPIEFTYPSNILSLVRLAMVGPTIYTLLRDDHGKRALALIALGMLTDLADGPLARRRGQVSELGKLIDPIADKLMLDGVALALSIKRDFPWWVTNLLLARDAAILLGALVVFRRTEHITTAIHVGKLTTALLTVTLLLYLLNAQPWARRMLNLTMIPFAISWVLYGARYLRSLRGASLDLPSS